MKKIKVVSLFSGIGGFETGLFHAYGKERTDVLFASEIDSYTQKAYEVLYEIKPFGDITKIDERDVPEHELLIGGFPCQAFSQAGLRKGFEDVRGTLFFDIARIAKEKRPNWLFLENVKGLVNHDRGRTLTVILETLSGLGYAVDFQILNSSRYGVAQNRERIFIVASKKATPSSWVIEKEKTSVNEAKRRLSQNKHIRTFSFPFPKGNEPRVRLQDVLEEEVDEKYYMDKPFRLLPVAVDCEDTIRLIQVARLDMKGNDSVRRVYSPKGLAPTLTTMGGGHREPKIYINDRVRKLTPLECFRVQGFPDEYYFQLKEVGFSDSRLYKFIGNAVTPTVIREIAKEICNNR